MTAFYRPFRVYSREGVFVAFSQATLGQWLFNSGVVSDDLVDGLVGDLVRPDLRIELPGGGVAAASFLRECIQAYRNQCERRAWYDSYCPIRRYRSYRWHNLSKRLRHMKTAQEKRLYGMVLREDGEPPVRAARRPRALPDLYDDFWRHNEKNWKRHRCTQWRISED
jgi:hypothetical protein